MVTRGSTPSTPGIDTTGGPERTSAAAVNLGATHLATDGGRPRSAPRSGRSAGETYNRLLQALAQLLQEAEPAADAGVREWAVLAMLDAVDLGEELGMLWDVEAERRRTAVREAFGEVDRQ